MLVCRTDQPQTPLEEPRRERERGDAFRQLADDQGSGGVGSGVSIAPVRVIESKVNQGCLAAVKLRVLGLYQPLGIIHRKRKKFNRATQSFLNLLQ